MKLNYDIAGESGSLILGGASAAVGLALVVLFWRLTPDQRTPVVDALGATALTIAAVVAIKQFIRWFDWRAAMREVEAHERDAGLEPKGDLDERLARAAGQLLRSNPAFQKTLRSARQREQ